MEKARVLIVDDNEEILEILAELLEEEGYQVACCTTGLSALLRIGLLRPQVVILDIKLDDISGFDVHRALRQDPDLAATPILFVSGVLLDVELLRTQTGDPDAQLLLKPIPGEILIEEIERIRLRRAA